MYIPGLIGTQRLHWLVDTGAVRTVISRKAYQELPIESRFALRETETEMFAADGRHVKTYGCGDISLLLGTQEVFMNVLVADIEDAGILGMDFLTATGASIDVAGRRLLMNGESLYCAEISSQYVSFRCVVRRSVVITPNSQTVVPVKLNKRQWKSGIPEAHRGQRILEPCTSFQLKAKGILVGSTLVDVSDGKPLFVRVLNVSDEPQTIGANTVVALAKPINDITVLNEPGSDTADLPAVINESMGDSPEESLPQPLHELWERSSKHLTKGESSKMANLLLKYKHVFSLTDSDLGKTDLVQHRINTDNAVPIRQRPRRTSPWKQEEIKRQLTDLIEKGAVEESNSPWASPVVLVTKKDGTKRFCVDYRQLNSVTVKDAYPLPRIDDSLDALSGSCWFSTLDLASGYWQVALDPETKHKTAFITPHGLFEWRVMPFGLCNAPGTFERLMELILRGLHWKTCLIYLDDIIVFGTTFQENLERLEEVFLRLAKTGLKLKPVKCNLFQKEVAYLGHIVSQRGISTDPAKTDMVRQWPTPTSATEVRSFLGLASYYRRFMPQFAQVAHPLHQLTERDMDFAWSEACQQAFDQLKTMLTAAPVLAYPQPKGKFILDTDASNHGIGAVLSQIQHGVERPIAYSSRTLTKAERNYCVTRRELLAVVEFVKQHRHYLCDRKFIIRIDHSPIPSVLRAKEPEGQLARWIELLSTFDIEFVYRTGKRHCNADSMSRRPCTERCKWCVKANPLPVPTTSQAGTQTEIAVPVNASSTCAAVRLQPKWTAETLLQDQTEDADIACFMELRQQFGTKPKCSCRQVKHQVG